MSKKKVPCPVCADLSVSDVRCACEGTKKLEADAARDLRLQLDYSRLRRRLKRLDR